MTDFSNLSPEEKARLDAGNEFLKNRFNSNLQISVEAAVKEDPDKHAESLSLGKKMDVSPDTVKQNFLEFKSIDQSAEIIKKLKDQDAVRRAFQDPDFAAMAHDDVESLLKLNEALKKKHPPKETEKGTEYATLAIKEKPESIEGDWADQLLHPLKTTTERWGSSAAGIDVRSDAEALSHLMKVKKMHDEGYTSFWDKFFYTDKKPKPERTTKDYLKMFTPIPLAMMQSVEKAQKTIPSSYLAMSPEEVDKEIAIKRADVETKLDAWLAMQEHIAKTKPFVRGESIKDYAGMVETTVIDMAPVIAMNYATRGRAGQALGLGLMGMQVYGNKYAEILKKSNDPAEAHTVASVYALAETLTELGPLDAITGKYGKQFAKRLLLSMGLEGTQEASTAIIEGVYEEMRDGDKNMVEAINAIVSDPEKLNKLITETRQQFVVGGVVGGTFATAGAVGEKAYEKSVQKKIEAKVKEVSDFQKDFDSSQNAEFTKQKAVEIGEAAQEAKLSERSPEAMEKFVEEITKEQDTKNVYFDAKDFQQFWQDQGVDINEVAKEIPAVAAQLDEIKTGVGDVVIPITQYVSKIAASQFNQGLSEHVRFHKDDMSASQAKVWNEQAEQQYQAEVDRIMKQHENAAQHIASADEVEKDITQKIVNTGRFSEEHAKPYAKLMKHIAITMSDRLGITPMEFHQKYNLQFQRTPIEGAKGETFAEPVDTAAPREVYQDEIKSTLGIDVQELSEEEYQDALKQLQTARSQVQAQKVLHTTVEGKAARQDWTAATRIRGTDGNPLRIYRGSRGPLKTTSFTEERLGGSTGHPTAKLGVWFSSEVEDATKYGQPFDYHLDLRNPYVMTTDEFPNFASNEEAIKFREKLKAQGYDGIVVDYRDVEGPVHFVSFAPESVIPAKQELYQQQIKDQTKSKAFKKWFKGSKVVDEDGNPMVMYHGTTHDFAEFSPERGNPENDFGIGYYFTSSQDDVSANYAGEGPDLTNRIIQMAERLEYEIEELINEGGLDAVEEKYGKDVIPKGKGDASDIAREIAKKELSGGASNVMPVYLSIKNPVILGGENETILGEMTFDEDTGEESGPGLELYDALNMVATEFDEADPQKIWADLVESGISEGLGASQIVSIMKESEGAMYIQTQDTGALASGEYIRQVFAYMGYDGIIDNTVYEKFGYGKKKGKAMEGVDYGSTHVIAFKPTQIKSAIGNIGTFNPDNANILFQQDTTPIWYSALERELNIAKQSKANAKDWKAIIKKLPGVKQDEIDAIGLNEWLDLQGGQVTRDQVLEFVKSNGVHLQEVVKGEPEAVNLKIAEKEFIDEFVKNGWSERDAKDATIDAVRDQFTYHQMRNFTPSQKQAIKNLKAAYENRGESTPTNFDKYQLPGGENYREMLLTLPPNDGQYVPLKELPDNYELITDSSKPEDQRWGIVPSDQLSAMPFAGRHPTKEAAISAALSRINAQRFAEFSESNKKKQFISAHFDEPNILAHIRFNDRVDADGKKVLFIEEIQSDWAQKGRKEGFVVKIKNVREDANVWVVYRADGTFVDVPKTEARSEEEAIAYAVNNAELTIFRGTPKAEGVQPGPFVQDTKAWSMLAMKRMIRYAAENGYDRIAWTTGEQQAERYKLSNHVDSVSAARVESGLYSIDVTKDGNLVAQKTLGQDELDGFIGRELADKIRNNKEVQSGFVTTFSGQDLMVGGEGMNAFYDKMLPQFTNKYISRYGAKVDYTDVKASNEQYRGMYEIYEGGSNESYAGPFKSMEEALKNKQNESDIIKEIGLKKVHSFIVTDALRESVMKGQPLFQEKRGSIQFPEDISKTPSVMTLFEKSDFSTIIHELGHFYFEVLRDIASNGEGPVDIKQDMDTLLKYIGVDSIHTWNQMTLEERRDGHEKIARSFEAYLFEGKAPNPELHGLFQRFMNWLTSVYKSIKALNVNITPDVRDVFDRMVASKDQIEAAKVNRMYHTMFENAEQAGMTPEEWKAYKDLDNDGVNQSIEELTQRNLKDMQWLQNAKIKKLKELQKANAEKRAAMREKVAEEVRQRPIYAAMNFLKYGTNAEGVSEPWSKLAIPALEEMYPEVPEGEFAPPPPEWRKLGAGKHGMLSATGVHPDIAASTFGFQSGDQLVRELLEARPINEVIDEITDVRMIQEYGDITNQKAMEQAVNDSLHNDLRARMIAAELDALNKAAGKPRTVYRAAVDYVKMALGKKKVADINPASFLTAENKAARATEEAFRKGDVAQAAESKRAHMLNNIFYRESSKVAKEIDRAYKYLNKFNKESARQKLTYDYLEQIDALLEPFDLRKNASKKEIERRKSLLDWVESQKNQGFEPVIDDALIAAASKKHWKQMTLNEMRVMVDTVKQIEHFGRLKQTLLTAKDKREFAARISEANESIKKHAKKVVPEQATAADIAGRAADLAKGLTADHRKMASIIREMDGHQDGGVMWELFLRPANEANDKETSMKHQAAKKLADIFEPVLSLKREVLSNIKATKKPIPGTNLRLTDEQRHMIAMNWGNEGNRQRLMDSGLAGHRGLTPQEISAILDTLTQKEWDFVQGVWDYIGTYKEQIAELEKRLTGIEPEWVEPSPIVTKYGTYRGGYFPAKYDAKLSTRSESLEAATDLRMGMKGAFQSATTRDGFTQKRAEEVKGRPLLLSYNVISNHVNEVIHRLAWQEWITDANRIIKALDEPIREHYGDHILRQFKELTVDIAQGDAGPTGYMDKGINWLRTGSTIVGLGWRFSTAAIQITGLSQSWARIGGKHIAKGIGQFSKNPMKAAEFVNSKSSMMEERSRTQWRETSEIMNTVRAGKRMTALNASFFWAIGKMQKGVDIPTWLGAYDKALDMLHVEQAKDQAERDAIDAKAVALADQAVIDSQGSGQVLNLAKIQRGGPALKLFTNFYSYFNTTYNLNVEAFKKVSFKSPASVAQFIGDMMLINIMPVFLTTVLNSLFRQDCDDMECILKKMPSETTNYLLGQIVLLRDLSPGFMPLTGGKSYGYSGPAGLRFYSSFTKLGAELANGEFDSKFWKALNETAGVLIHYPAGQVNNTLEGIVAIEQGKVDGFWPSVAALMAGPPKK